MHPKEVNDERITLKAGRRKIWTERDEDLLSTTANQIWREGMRKATLYQHLQDLFPHRSTEAIKRRLLFLKWQPQIADPDTRPPDDPTPPLGRTIQRTDPNPTTSTPGSRRQQIDPITIRTTGRKWTEEEEASLRRVANSIWQPTMSKKELTELSTLALPHRSADAIGKRLRLIKWIPPTTSPPSDQPPARSPIPPPADITTAKTPRLTTQDTYVNWRRRMLDSTLDNLQEPTPLAAALRKIAKSLLEDTLTTEEGATAVEEQVAEIFPSTWHQKGTRTKVQHRPNTKRELRRQQYASTQRLMSTSRKDAATAVLNGSWREANQGTPSAPQGLNDYWARIIGMDGPPAKAPTTIRRETHWTLLDPIGVEELRTSLKTLTSKAVGMDKLTATDLLSWHLPTLVGLLNLILLTENLPTPLARSRIMMIPKLSSPLDNNDYRPLAISPILTRALHKIIARRMRDQLVFSPTQFAFLQRDGCLEASVVLHAILRNSHDKQRPLALAFLDLSKAFDTITHEALGEAAERAGIPAPLLKYINNALSRSESVIGPHTIRTRRGVKQGDPLSPILFVLAMERPISGPVPTSG
ncbi:MAG: RNA-directed DNA polymerase [Aeromonas sp.]